MSGSKTKPLVSVILPAYNAEAHLAEALESILNQTYRDLELLIIDDGSKDRTAEIIAGFQDPRIRLIRNEVNLGLIGSLNKAIALAEGAYLARMDADDIALPERLQWQVEYLEAHPEISVLGGGIEFIDEKGRVTGRPRQLICGPELIPWRFLFGNCLNHPAVMMRKHDIIACGELYSDRFKHAEDYEFWLRLSRSVKINNLDRCVLRYRIHGSSISVVHNRHQVDSSVRALKEHVQLRFGEVVDERVLEAILFPRLSENIGDSEIASYFERHSPWALRGQLTSCGREAKVLFRFLLAKLIFFRLKRFKTLSPGLVGLYARSFR